MSVDNMKAQMRKGILEYCILLLLKRDGKLYANDIIQSLKDADLIVVEGTLYPLLSRLKKGGLLNYDTIVSAQGPPRKYYSLTILGEQALAQLQNNWTALENTISKLSSKEENFPIKYEDAL
ncbi:PadR family transcriptional regulator [Porphyromonas pogonae]|uniref:PadR family transcriptional regulator n=1 Tax=Porphyromonas pogonae TaxID=867595 RepID=UPI002E792288|nr:PadR family transcriptional regulator [Porphyromonas pogonae]